MTERPISIDRLIDDVARSMSAPAVGLENDTPALRARVVANLGHRRRRPTGFLIPVTVLASAAALAVAAHWPLVRPIGNSESRNAAPTSLVARADVPVPGAPTTVATVAAPTRTARRAATAAQTESEPDDGPSIAALPDIAALPVSSIQPKPLDVAQLNVGRVASVTPLSVAALDDIDRDR